MQIAKRCFGLPREPQNVQGATELVSAASRVAPKPFPKETFFSGMALAFSGTVMISQSATAKLATNGKFLAQGSEKIFLKAVRLALADEPLGFSQKLKLRARMAELRDSRANAVVVGGPQAECALDLAYQTGLFAILEIAVAPDKLMERQGRRAVAAQVARTVALFRGHPALAGYLLDLPMSADWLRMRGLTRVGRRLHSLLGAARSHDANALIAVNHRPWTRALAGEAEDLLYSSVPPMTPAELRSYLLSLHNDAGARPVVIELGRGTPMQDEMVGCAFALGAAGVVAPQAPAPPALSLLQARPLGAAELMPFLALNGTCPPMPRRVPKVSVVICAYNAERTMRACLQSLRALEYPDFEVVIVDDGSRDRTAEIALEFPEFRLIRQPNRGLSVARNVGLHAARGEIVAYTDSDCVADPHWLTLMVNAMVEGALGGCGGPNYAPAEEGRIEACVAAAPGAPCHVLTADDRAEHLAGCNMVFRKSVLIALGGFDPQFSAAGDDVDICWRALDAGQVLGFCPGAFVWHFRRNTVSAYHGQQRGYGRAEALLYFKYPQRFNALGQVMWRGRVPGLAQTLPGGARKRVYWGTGARGFFQTIYEPEQGLLKFLPQTLEWNLMAVALVALAPLSRYVAMAGLAMMAMGPLWALYGAWRAPIEKAHARLSSRLLVALLSYTGPLVRALARYRLRLRRAWSARLGAAAPPRQRPTIDWLGAGVRLAYWNESYTTRDALLGRLVQLLSRLGYPVIGDSGWNDFDLEVRPDPWTRLEIKTADEEHEGGRLKNHVLARVRLSPLGPLALAAGFAAAALSGLAGWPAVGVVLGELTLMGAAVVLSEVVESGRLAYRAIEQCAAELGLMPLGKPTSAARAAAALAQVGSAASTEAFSSTAISADHSSAD